MFRFRKGMFLLTLAAVCSTFFTVSAEAELKIGYMRSDYIFSKYEPYTQAQKQLEEYQKKEMEKLQKLNDDLERKAEEARSNELLMTPEMKQLKRDELEKQSQDLQRQYEELMNPETGLMVKKQTELIQPIINRINDVLMRLAKADGYDYIFDAFPGAQGNVILFANEQYDISEQILEELIKDTSSQ